MKRVPAFLLIVVFLFLGTTLYAEEATLSFSPTEVIQGEPFLIQVNGVATSTVKKITFEGKTLKVFTYKNKPTALVGIDLRKTPGEYPVIAELNDGNILKSDFKVLAREKIEAPLGIPEKLGGNTTQSQNTLVSTLAEENKTLENLYTSYKTFWTSSFSMPLKEITITDPYGYSRQTGSYTLAHKGTDFRAKEGTAVMAINRGVVRVVRTYRNYGKVIVVDHGLGLMSFYLHLSKMKVNVGELVQKGQVIGLSGQTGYVTAPHLHLSIRINNISVDPIKFLDLFK